MSAIELECPNCSTLISFPSVGQFNCPKCAQTVEVNNLPAPIPLVVETSIPYGGAIFNEEGVIINGEQIIAENLVVSIQNISALTTKTVNPKRFWPTVGLVIGTLQAGGALVQTLLEKNSRCGFFQRFSLSLRYFSYFQESLNIWSSSCPPGLNRF